MEDPMRTGYAQDESVSYSLLEKERNIPLPDSLFEQYDCTTLIAYISGSVDNFQLYQEQEQVIVAVGLVKPIQGVFIEQIQYLIVIATPSEISLVGVAFEGKDKSQLQLYNTQLSASSDNVTMNCIVGTNQGRIFMCGNNGQLYELLYNAGNDGYFSKRKCRKLNHSTSAISYFLPSFMTWRSDVPIVKITVDPKRNILYTLNEKSQIDVVYLGEEGKSFEKIVSCFEFLSSLSRQTEFFGINDDLRPLRVVSIDVVDVTESSEIHLVCVLSDGSRVFLTTTTSGFYSTVPVPGQLLIRRPESLSVVAVRPAPPSFNSISGSGNSNDRVHTAYYKQGFMACANVVSEEVDAIMSINFDIGTMTRRPNVLSEIVSSLFVEGKTWDIAEVPGFAQDLLPGDSLNELATQISQSQRKVILLTNSGVMVCKKKRPVDVLQQLLTESAGQLTVPLSNFFNHYGADQSCAMCLAIAVGNPSVSSVKVGPTMSPKFSNQAISTGARRFFFELGGKATIRDLTGLGSNLFSLTLVMNVQGGSVVPQPEIAYSGRHDGFLLYLHRILKPIWRQRIFVAKPQDKFECHLSIDLLLDVQRKLEALNDFLLQNPFFTQPPNPSDYEMQRSMGGLSQNDVFALQAEQKSLNDSHVLVSQSIEAISFLLLLIDHNVPSLLKRMVSSSKKEVLDLSFENLVASPQGRLVSKALINEVVSRQIESQIEVGTISDLLRRKCPSYCTPDDIIFYKGMESLRKAKTGFSPSEREAMLKESLRLFTDVIDTVTFDKLDQIIEIYRQMKFCTGILDLGLLYAKRKDPVGYGLAFYLERQDGQTTTSEYFDIRKKCYQLIFNVMAELTSASPTKGQKDNSAIRKAFFDRATDSDDELFHYCYYEWLLSQGMVDHFLQTKSVFVERWLTWQREDVQYADLLWQFYVQNSKFTFAARVLKELAMSETIPIGLGQRIEYLSRALSNAKSGSLSLSPEDAELLQEIEDAMEVSQLQLEVLAAVKTLPEYAEHVEILNGKIFEVNDLYHQYVKPLDLLELELMIYNIANYQNTYAVESAWVNLIEKVEADALSKGLKVTDCIIEKVRDLGRRFYPNENVFPLAFLVGFLEARAFEKKATYGGPGWVSSALRDCGVPYEAIFEAQNALFETKSEPFKTNQAISFLLQDIASLLHEWIGHVKASSRDAERSAFPRKIVDECIGKYLVFPLSNDVSGVISRLQAIQSTLRAMN